MKRAGARATGQPRQPASPESTPEATVDQPAQAGSPAVEGRAVEGRAVEGSAVEGSAVEGSAVEGRAVEGRAVEGRAVEGSVVEGPAVGILATDGSVFYGPDGGGMPERQPWAGWDPIIRLGGVLVSVVAAFVTGVLELLLSTLRWGDLSTVWRGEAIGSGGGPLLGLSIVLAAVANYGIASFAVATTGRRWAMGPPWALWTLMMLFAAGVRTPEGDYLLAGTDWVALVAILVGSLAFAVYSYRLILKPLRS